METSAGAGSATTSRSSAARSMSPSSVSGMTSTLAPVRLATYLPGTALLVGCCTKLRGANGVASRAETGPGHALMGASPCCMLSID